jgi:EAL domain-containing protein (putative c-di-GMP-specific phosphodiesterase class I)
METGISLTDLHAGLRNHEFSYYYQPIFSLVTGWMCAAEALLRWHRADGTLLMPADFIPLAEQTGFITELTQEMFPHLIGDLTRIALYGPFLTVNLNLSSKDLESDQLVFSISQNLANAGVDPQHLGIEIVERVLMPPNYRIRKSIFDFAEAGMPLVLNDFSAGNSTLNYLSQLPLSTIKLSMNIVQNAALSRMDFRILRHLVSIGQQLQLNVIAEGIENDELYNLILSTGCAAAQGYHFSYPLPLAEFCALLEQKPRWTNYPFGLEYLSQINHIDFRRDVIREALIIYTTLDEAVRRRALDRLPLLEPGECQLGEWYIDIGQEWSAEPGFAELGKAHTEFHAAAKALVRAAQEHAAPARISKLISVMENLSIEIMTYLQRFAMAGLRQHYRLGRGSKNPNTSSQRNM